MEAARLTVLYSALFLIALTLAIYTLWSQFSTLKPSEKGINPVYVKPTESFNYTTYLLSKNPVDISTYDECVRLKIAIKNSIITGRPYKVDEIAYGSDIPNEVVPFPLIGDCLSEPLEIEIANGLNQTVCLFQTMNPANIQYLNASDTANLFYDNCVYSPQPIFNSPLISRVIEGYFNWPYFGYVGPANELEGSMEKVFISPDYLYVKNGDYSHSILYNNATAFNNAYNGPGRLKIYVANASSRGGLCTYNIYFCYRPALAKYVENSTITIFKLFRDLELHDLNVIPYYIRNFTDKSTPQSPYKENIYYWNYYDIKLDGEYNVTSLLNSIKAGLEENAMAKATSYLSTFFDYGRYYWSHPHWDMSQDDSVDRTRDCWSPTFDNRIADIPSSSRTRSIRFNCGDDNTCSGWLRIKIAMRHDYRQDADLDGDSENEKINYMSGVISFCDEGTMGAYCGNNRLDPNEQCDCGMTSDCTDEGTGGDLNGATCNSLNYQSGPLGCTLSCTYDTSNCVPYVCGDLAKNGFEQCDGSDFGASTCASLGFKSGSLACKPPGDPSQCTIDTSSCVPHVCGDGIRGGGELCDGSDLGGNTCASLGYTPTCPDKCVGGIEYRNGAGGGVGTLACISPPNVNACRFNTNGCLACTYDTKTCKFGCKPDNVNCYSGLWCNRYGGRDDHPGVCGDLSDGLLDPCVGGECFNDAQCVKKDEILPQYTPGCQWFDMWVGLCWGCCSEWKTCRTPESECYIDDANCKYS